MCKKRCRKCRRRKSRVQPCPIKGLLNRREQVLLAGRTHETTRNRIFSRGGAKATESRLDQPQPSAQSLMLRQTRSIRTTPDELLISPASHPIATIPNHHPVEQETMPRVPNAKSTSRKWAERKKEKKKKSCREEPCHRDNDMIQRSPPRS